MKMNAVSRIKLSFMTNLFFVSAILSLMTLTSYAQVTGLPLIKGHMGGDTVVHSSDDFIVHGRTFTPVNTVSIIWETSANTFTVIGEVTSDLNFYETHFSMGSSSVSYFQLNGSGSITTYKPNVIDTFQLSGQKYLGLADETFYAYHASTSEEQVYGNVRIFLDGNHFSGRMGSSEDPGAILFNNNTRKVWVHIEDLIHIKGLITHELSKTDIVIRHLEGDPVNTYYGYGFWAIYILETAQLASLGTGANPGMVIKNSVIDSVHMKAGGGGFVFGVLPILDAVDIRYNHDFGKYAINGLINLGVPLGGVAKTFGAPYAPSFQINAGDESNPGFLLNTSNGKFEVEDATFSLKNINTEAKVANGGFDINELTVGVKNNWPDSIYGRGTFPPGFSLEISLGFHLNQQEASPDSRFFINSIGVTWQAANISQAIALGTTGFQMVKIGGEINNLLDLRNISITGDIGMVYGEPIQFDPGVFGLSGGVRDISIVYVEGVLTLSTAGISFHAIGDIGAFFTNGHWQGIMAEVEGDIDIKWGGGVDLAASIKAYATPNDAIDAQANLSFHSSGDIDATGTAIMQIPPSIPVIGGKRIGNAHFAFRHRHSDLGKSYAAAWSKFNLGFDHIVAGIKANLKTGHISKVGAKQARALTHQNISDPLQHPIGPNGEPNNNWYACGLTHHFSLTSDFPPAYLQNQIVINDSRFENPFVQHQFWSPAIATVISPSSNLDLKILTPEDEHDTYFNQGQTTPQDNTMAIDFSMDFTEGGSDTINWITVNEAAEAYSSIDWIHQPDLLLTPGEYVLTITGYCNIHAEPLGIEDMKLNVSPVYPRPSISLTGDGTGNFTIDYSSYVNDSTSVSLYWNYDQGKGGNLIGHLPYHEGTLIGDSLYRWEIENWFPGLIAEPIIYFYAVIDDFVNNPVRSEYVSVSYVPNLRVTVTGGDSTTAITLTPADTTIHDIPGINNGDATFFFANVPVGEYKVDAYNTDTSKIFNFSMGVNTIDGSLINAKYHTPDWASVDFTVLNWDNGLGDVYFQLEGTNLSLYGEITDTAGVSVGGDAIVTLLNGQNEIVSQQHVSDPGYMFDNIDTGYYKMVVQLPPANYFHWPSTDDLHYVVMEDLVGIVYIRDSVEITPIAKGLDFRVLPGPMGPVFNAVDFNNNPVENVVITIWRQDGTGTIHQAVSNENGLAFFDAEGVATFTNYYFSMAWPEGYHTLTPQGQTFQWTGWTDPQLVIGQED